MIRPLSSRLFAPVDIAALVVFRILFGGIMLWEVCRFFEADWISRYYLEPKLFFTYYGFSWVHPWPGNGMYIHFVILGASAFFMAIGFLYRISAALFFLGFTYVFLLDQSNYLNHFYFVCLVSFLMIFEPANCAFSLDAWRRPQIKTAFVPAWGPFLLKAQLAIVYIGAGVAKVNWDFMNGQPMRMWLAERSHYTILGYDVGSLFAHEWAVWFFSYGGLLFDLFIVPALLWKRTRIIAFAAVTFFHLMNSYLFDIGIFPWISLGATYTLFLPPDWPRRILRPWSQGVPLRAPAPVELRPAIRRTIVSLVCAYLAIQVFVPLRHFMYPGVVHWTEEGHRFSWHMKLRDKDARGVFWVTDHTNARKKRINPNDDTTMSKRQVAKMLKTPDMILQYAHHLAEIARRDEHRDIEVRADIESSLNGRPYQKLIDPAVNLATEPRSLRHAEWILPLETPLQTPSP